MPVFILTLRVYIHCAGYQSMAENKEKLREELAVGLRLFRVDILGSDVLRRLGSFNNDTCRCEGSK